MFIICNQTPQAAFIYCKLLWILKDGCKLFLCKSLADFKSLDDDDPSGSNFGELFFELCVLLCECSVTYMMKHDIFHLDSIYARFWMVMCSVDHFEFL